MNLNEFANLYRATDALIVQSVEFTKICGKEEGADVQMIMKDAQELMFELEEIFYTLIPDSKNEAKKMSGFSFDVFWKLIDDYPKLSEGKTSYLYALLP